MSIGYNSYVVNDNHRLSPKQFILDRRFIIFLKIKILNTDMKAKKKDYGQKFTKSSFKLF